MVGDEAVFGFIYAYIILKNGAISCSKQWQGALLPTIAKFFTSIFFLTCVLLVILWYSTDA